MTKTRLLIAAAALIALISNGKTMEARTAYDQFATAPAITLAENEIHLAIIRAISSGRL